MKSERRGKEMGRGGKRGEEAHRWRGEKGETQEMRRRVER